MNKILKKLIFNIKNRKGATIIEYVMIVSVLSIALVGSYKTIGRSYMDMYNTIVKKIS